MKLKFYKYQGAGNDFVLIDNRSATLLYDEVLFEAICNRRFGVGGDGIMLLQQKEGYDFEMIYANADGKPASMCGNGGRCLVAFAKRLGIIHTETTFMAVDGPHYAKMTDLGVSLQMINVNRIEIGEDYYVLNTGSPHFVQFSSDVQKKDVFKEGRKIRNSERFKVDGINVNFVEEQGDLLHVRTYERGVEDETLACGTGVTAAALSAMLKNNLQGRQFFSIQTQGGRLSVSATRSGEQSFNDIFLEGPAEYVFEGELDMDFHL